MRTGEAMNERTPLRAMRPEARELLNLLSQQIGLGMPLLPLIVAAERAREARAGSMDA